MGLRERKGKGKGGREGEGGKEEDRTEERREGERSKGEWRGELQEEMKGQHVLTVKMEAAHLESAQKAKQWHTL